MTIFVHGTPVFRRLAEDPPESLVVAPNKEKLAVLNDVREVVIGSVTHVRDINDGRTVFVRIIDYLAKSVVLIDAFPALDHEIRESPVKDGKAGVNIEAVESRRRDRCRRTKRFSVIRIPPNLQR